MTDRKPNTLWLRPADLGVFVLYIAMICIVVPLHEPWVDEAQAWLLARDLSLPSLLFHNLRHEGHPALWYLILWIPSHLHVNYAFFNWISAAIGTIGIYVLLRFAPFPFYLRALLPFTFYLAYEYSVVARSYVLFPLLGFLVAHLYRQKPPHPVAMAVVLSLLANVSLHGTIVALVFAFLYAWKLSARQPDTAKTTSAPRELRRAVIVFSCSILFAAVCLWPVRGGLPRVSPTLNKIVDLLSLPDSSTPPPTPANKGPAQDSGAARTTQVPANTATVPSVTAANSHSLPAIRGRIANIPIVIGFAFAGNWVVAALFQCLVLVYLFRLGQLKLALPALFLALFLIFVYSAPWHLGLLWVTFLMILWAAWDTAIPPGAVALQNAVAVFLGILCVFQLPWTVHALEYDAQNPVSPARDTAAYLHTFPEGSRMAGFGMSTAVQPYFSHNIFFNQQQTFGYLGFLPNRMSTEEAVAMHPDVIVADGPQRPVFERSGYLPVREFCGAIYFPNRPIDPGCLVVLVPAAK